MIAAFRARKLPISVFKTREVVPSIAHSTKEDPFFSSPIPLAPFSPELSRTGPEYY